MGPLNGSSLRPITFVHDITEDVKQFDNTACKEFSGRNH
jgi:hypothetical protein